VLHLPGAPDGKQANLFIASVYGTQAPQGVIKAVAFNNGEDRQRFVVCLSLSQVREKFFPSTSTRTMRTDFIESSLHLFHQYIKVLKSKPSIF